MSRTYVLGDEQQGPARWTTTSRRESCRGVRLLVVVERIGEPPDVEPSLPRHTRTPNRMTADDFDVVDERERLLAEAQQLAATRQKLAEELQKLQGERLQLQKERGELYRTAERQAAEFRKHQEALAAERCRLDEERARLYAEARSYVEEFREEARIRREELARAETAIQQRERELDQRLRLVRAEEARILALGTATTERAELLKEELSRIAGISRQEAREDLRRHLLDEVKRDYADQLRKMTERVKEEADIRAARILVTAMQRLAPDIVQTLPLAVVELPSEDYKARIIGKDGRNIRTFESVTGVNLELEESSDTVVISSHDPLRRERARLCLEELVADGRIQPNRIEAMYERVTRRLDRELFEEGERAVQEFGFTDMNKEIVRVLGSLKLRDSMGQNVLEHLKECARLARMVAEELQIDPAAATRGALLHDLGKGLRHVHQGTHASVGAWFARRHGESEAVCHAIEAHHDEVEPRTVDAVIVQVVDHLSGGRPGARDGGSRDHYVRRLEDLERLCKQHRGVRDAYAFQGGREIRVIVDPYAVDDTGAILLAQELVKDIESEGLFPNNVRVTVIREFRASETSNGRVPQ